MYSSGHYDKGVDLMDTPLKKEDYADIRFFVTEWEDDAQVDCFTIWGDLTEAERAILEAWVDEHLDELVNWNFITYDC